MNNHNAGRFTEAKYSAAAARRRLEVVTPSEHCPGQDASFPWPPAWPSQKMATVLFKMHEVWPLALALARIDPTVWPDPSVGHLEACSDSER